MSTTTEDVPVPLAADAGRAGLDEAGLGRLTAAIQGDIDSGLHYGATVLMARAGVVGYHQAIGRADVTRDRPSGLDDLYFLMSVSKSFTAVAVLQCVDRGLIGLDTRIADLIPEYAARGKQRVTVYNLLNHTGGAYSGFSLPAGMSPADQGDISRSVSFLAPLPVLHHPASRVVYSPWEGYTVLADVVRRVDPQLRSFRQYMHDEVFVPLGMTDSSFGAPVGHPRRVPIKVVKQTGAAQTAEAMEGLNATGEDFELPAASGYATTSDLFRFAESLRRRGDGGSTRVLSRALTDYAYRNHTGDMLNEFWDFTKQSEDFAEFPANFTLGGGYVRGRGHHLTPLGQTASPGAFGAVGSGTTMWMVDPVREVTVVFLSSGLVEGLRHFKRLQRLNDLALAAVL